MEDETQLTVEGRDGVVTITHGSQRMEMSIFAVPTLLGALLTEAPKACRTAEQGMHFMMETAKAIGTMSQQEKKNDGK